MIEEKKKQTPVNDKKNQFVCGSSDDNQDDKYLTRSKSSMLFGSRRSTKESSGPDTILPPRYITPPVPIAVFCKQSNESMR